MVETCPFRPACQDTPLRVRPDFILKYKLDSTKSDGSLSAPTTAGSAGAKPPPSHAQQGPSCATGGKSGNTL
ncbi:hypothetical protein AnigIFM63326_009149 [Aspergillus niger]|nr:hypothetical protein AnigIFM63326_009149 [Aspergillus niger]